MFKKNIKIDKDKKKLHDATVKFVPTESQLKFSEISIGENSLWKQSDDKLEIKKIADCLESSYKKEEFVELKNVSIAKFQLDESLSDEKPEILHKISEKWIDRSVIVIFSSDDREQFLIYWKTKELRNFLTLKDYNNEPLKFDTDLRKFIIEFLIISCNNGHTGLHRCCSLGYGKNQVELHFLADSRDYNLLFIASEQGYANVVNSLLELGISSEIPCVDVSPQILAWNNRHFDVLLTLLQANMTYPPSFNINECPKELQDFAEIANRLHASITEQNEGEIKKIIQLYPNLRYFYNCNNESAPKIALIHNYIEIYVILVRNKIFLGSHEDTEEIMINLSYEDRRKIREIHFEELQDLPEKHINILVGHSFVGHDSHDVKKKLNLVINAFRVLNNIPGIREILIVTAASKKFSIIFDFNRDSVQLMDPTVSSENKGLFYLSGRIYIGAKQLLDTATEACAFATLAHELCHYAVYLTFDNDANPYKKNDNKAMKEVERILILCEAQKEREDVILMLYILYSQELHHAELIVRIPHLLALYHDKPEKIEELRIIYDKLFYLYEKKVVPEMIKSVPEIESRMEKEIEKKDKKISKLKGFFICFVVFGTILSGLLGLLAYSLYSPTYKFSELSVSEKILVRNSSTSYKNVTVKFSDLFTDQDVYENLTSIQIGQMLKGKVLDLNNPQLLHLNLFIKFNWESLASKLKDKFLKSNFTFQNENVMFNEINQDPPDVFKYLNSIQIENVLDGKKLSIGKIVENSTKYYVERKFIYEDMAIFYSNFSVNNGNIDQFKLFMNNFLNRSIEAIAEDVEHYKNTSTVIDPVNYNNPYVQFYYKSIDTIINETEKLKVFILSSEAGSGKSFIFIQLALSIKKKYPTRWVAYINLRNHINIYDKMRSKFRSLDDVEKLLQELLNVDPGNKFEIQLFKERFKSGKITLLWDGFDEIAADYDNFIINVLKLIKNETIITQYVSTRTIYSSILRNNLRTISHVLVPFDKKLQNEFLQKLLTSQNVNFTSIDSKINRTTQTFESIVRSKSDLDRSSRELNTPLMLILIAEISEEKNFENNSNIFHIYKNFINKKLSVTSIKTGNINALFSDSRFNLNKFHQKYALRSIFLFVLLKPKLERLQIMKMKLPDKVTNNDISQMGILYLTSESEYEFAHKSFAEFFIAQYIIENIYDLSDEDDEVDGNEVALRVEMFFYYLLSRNLRAEYVTIFLKQFLLEPNKSSQKNFYHKISNLLRTKFKSRFLRIMRMQNEVLVEFMVDFFQKDHELLKDLLGINQIETFYTSLYKPSLGSCETKPDYIKNLMFNHLSEGEYKRFINGVDQKGSVLLGRFYCHKIGKDRFSAELTSRDEIFNHTSFANFYDALSLTLNQNEQIELYKSAVNPFIYFINLFKYEIFTNFSQSDYENLWEKLQNLSNNSALILKNSLGSSIAKFLDTDPEILNTNELLPFFLNKTKELLDPQNIFEMFKDNKILFRAIRQLRHFKKLWKFIVDNLSKEQQKEILQNIYDEDNQESGCDFLISFYHIFTYCSNKFKVFHFALLLEEQETFNYVSSIYEDNFSRQELQTIALSSIDIFLFMIAYENKESCCYFVLYLKNLFEGNYNDLYKFLIGDDQTTHINLHKHFKNYIPSHKANIPQLEAFVSLENITDTKSSGNIGTKYDFCDNLLKNVTQVIPSENETVLMKKVKSKNPFFPS